MITFEKYFFLFFAIFNGVFGLYREGECPGNKALNGIDLDRFFTGEWHEVKITPFNFGNYDKCGTIGFNALDNDVRYTYTRQGKIIFSQLGIITRDQNEVQVVIGFPGDESDSKLYVLDTDYENYGVLYTCSQESDSVVRERLFVLSRGKGLNSNVDISGILKKEGSDFMIGGRLKSCEDLEKPKAFDDCYVPDPVTGLFLDQFFNWKWYENNRTTNNIFDDKTTCGRFTYEHAPALPGDPMLVVLDHRYPESEYNFVVFGNATTDNNKKTVVTVQFPIDTLPSKYYVIYHDYSEAFIYSCVKEPTGVRERAWILSRQNNVTQETMNKIDAAIDDQEGLRLRLGGMKYCKDIKPTQTCYNISSKSNLNLNKFFNGTWNEVWRSKNEIESGNICGKVRYIYEPNQRRLKIQHDYRNIFPRRIIDGIADVSDGNEIINFKFPRISKTWERSNYTVVDTDYDNYAVVYNCWQKSMTKREERVWVLSRSSEIPAKGREKIQSDEYLRNLMKDDGIVCQ